MYHRTANMEEEISDIKKDVQDIISQCHVVLTRIEAYEKRIRNLAEMFGQNCQSTSKQCCDEPKIVVNKIERPPKRKNEKKDDSVWLSARKKPRQQAVGVPDDHDRHLSTEEILNMDTQLFLQRLEK